MRIIKPVFLIVFLFCIRNTGFLFAQTQVPVIENPNQQPVQYCSDPVAVASAISIENIKIDENTEGMKISISNYINGEDVLVFDNVGSFNYYWNENSGTLEITGVGSDSEYEEAVSKVYYENISSSHTSGIRTFSISLRDADYLPATGHFYRFISQESISWNSARSQAASKDYYGLQGYLATIRSKEEQDFILTKTKGTGWIGASDEEVEGTWKWMEGPDKGVIFWSGNSTGSSVNNEYSHWGSDEPNNLNGEDYAHIMYSVNKGYWNDLPNTGSTVVGYVPQGYLIEYGGMAGDPVLKLSAVAYVDVKDSEHPELDMNQVETLFCGSMTNTLNLAFTNGNPITELTPLNSQVVVTGGETDTPEITVPEYGTYSFQLDMTDDAGCFYRDTMEIGVHNQPEALIDLDEDECYGYNLQLVYTATTVEETYFTWYYNQEEFQSGLGLDSVLIPLGFDDQERTVGLKVNEQGCLDSITLPVKVKPDILVVDTNSVGCSPLEVRFQASANKPALSYSWDFGDGSNSADQNPTHVFVNPDDTLTPFDIRLTVVSNDGCENTAVFKKMVNVYPVPTAQFMPNPQEVLVTDPEISFVNSSHAATTFRWNFGDSTMFSEEENPVHRYDEMGVYPVALEVENNFGCIDSIIKLVTVTFDQLFPPNAFSPNASLEEDREFRIYGEGVVDEGYLLLVYNRWGGVIFESSSQEIGWDGKMKNSDLAPSGVYTWVLQYFDFTGEKHRQQGTVTLLY